MKKQEMSQVFDSDLQFLDPQTFNEVVMNEVELFSHDDFNSMVNELQTWDSKSLDEMQESMFAYLQTRNGGNLKLATNLVLDYCIGRDGKVDDFKVFIMTNTIEWLLNGSLRPMGMMSSASENEQE